MMIQIQDWEQSQKIVVVDEVNHGTVQVEVPKPGEYKVTPCPHHSKIIS